ncbi:hypothetical protein A2755_03475 [Candidatus Wolfebacteria bacterium RIFCSPHIGHO2_01_FULL_48_22]|uniref:DUF86 domain-containing protein n=2 Tax=Candidatus Wolfeibacteriota TaxID=1752735 RepID=A0A1F8DRY5_9BACT|nr:MAG: hypothetical protein A2755_03475 [Candidatus Wolfebacteria bacterium RIFCSPHIGHO2_01_FULL_48_22]OGM92088.1 MAG: hypothetical protein A2935_01965 [Candidatus Wolfebacteria bacterium RIFCSPLOWO2_01_FULL_47_17b]
MRKDPQTLLKHIKESIEWVESYVAGLSFEDFFRSQEKQDAVSKRLEIIGEAVKNLPQEIRDAHTEIPWKEITGMRDRLIHEYFSIDAELVWDTIGSDMTKLKKWVVEFLNKKE